MTEPTDEKPIFKVERLFLNYLCASKSTEPTEKKPMFTVGRLFLNYLCMNDRNSASYLVEKLPNKSTYL